ncbi:MAG: ACT domain-containing protein [Chloroflexota bacterium]
MRAKQVSVFVENKPGRLVAIVEALEKKGISIRGLSVSDAAEIGIVRLIMTDPEEGLEELRQAGFITRMDWVLCAEMPDVPGGLLHSVAKPIAEAGINMQYFYAYTEPSTNRAIAVVKVDDLEKAENVLNP